MTKDDRRIVNEIGQVKLLARRVQADVKNKAVKAVLDEACEQLQTAIEYMQG